MTEQRSLLQSLRQRRDRPIVPTRDDALVDQVQSPKQPETESAASVESLETGLSSESTLQAHSKSLRSEIARYAPIDGNRNQSINLPATSNSPGLTELEAQLARIPETARYSSITLEVALAEQLAQYCKARKITMETFLEGAWTVAKREPDFLDRVQQEAKRRYNQRKEAGRLRRLITSIQKEIKS